MRIGENTVRADGFTLIEILIAIAVFAIAVLGVTAMQTSSIRGNMQARVISAEVLEATSRVEALRMLSYDDLTDGAAGNTTWTVNTEHSGDDDEYKTVELIHTWQSQGATKTYTINFIKSPE